MSESWSFILLFWEGDLCPFRRALVLLSVFPLISRGGKVIVKEERLSVFFLCVKALWKSTSQNHFWRTDLLWGKGGGEYGAFPSQQWILAWYWQMTSSSHPAVGDLLSPDLEASIQGATEQSGILQPGKGMILRGMWQRPTKSGVAWRVGRDWLFLPFPMQELEANKCGQWGQISNKWREMVLDVPGNRPGELLIRGWCCGYKVQRKTIVFQSKSTDSFCWRQ